MKVVSFATNLSAEIQALRRQCSWGWGGSEVGSARGGRRVKTDRYIHVNLPMRSEKVVIIVETLQAGLYQ